MKVFDRTGLFSTLICLAIACGLAACAADVRPTANPTSIDGTDIRVRARLLGYIYGDGSCAGKDGAGDQVAVVLYRAPYDRALHCARVMEKAGQAKVVSANGKRIVLDDLPWDVPFRKVTFAKSGKSFWMTFPNGPPRDPKDPEKWAPEVFDSSFLAAIIECEGTSAGLIIDQSGWGDFPKHITEIKELLESPCYDLDPYMEANGKKLFIPKEKFPVVRGYDYANVNRVPGGPEGLTARPAPLLLHARAETEATTAPTEFHHSRPSQ